MKNFISLFHESIIVFLLLFSSYSFVAANTANFDLSDNGKFTNVQLSSNTASNATASDFQTQESFSNEQVNGSFSEDDVILLNDQVRELPSKYYNYTGTVLNNGSIDIDSVTVRMIFVNNTNQSIGQASDLTDQPHILPGTVSPFDIIINGSTEVFANASDYFTALSWITPDGNKISKIIEDRAVFIPFDEFNQSSGDCTSSYPDFCIPSPPPDLNCDDISQNNFAVEGSDPHGFDSDNDGIGCEAAGPDGDGPDGDGPDGDGPDGDGPDGDGPDGDGPDGDGPDGDGPDGDGPDGDGPDGDGPDGDGPDGDGPDGDGPDGDGPDGDGPDGDGPDGEAV